MQKNIGPKDYVECLFMATLVLLIGLGTYQRNLVWKDDVTLWSDVLKKSESKARPYAALCQAFRKSGHINQAISMGERGVALNPNYAEARLNLAVSYIEMRRYEDAIPHLLTAMSLEPAMWQIYAAFGMAYSGLGQTDNAISTIQEGLKLRPENVKMRVNLAVAYGVKGMYDLAAVQLQEVLSEYPNDHDARFNLGIAYGLQGKHEASFSELTEAVRLKPDHAKALYYLGELYRDHLKDRQTALFLYRQIVGLGRPEDPVTAMAEKSIREMTNEE